MTCVSSDLFNQASSQLNFLLLSQRTVILISAFNIAFASFASTKEYYLSKFLVLILFIYSIAYGIVAAMDFNNYIKETEEDIRCGTIDAGKQRELDLLKNFKKWSYFSYALVGIVIFIMLTYTKVEFFNLFQRSLGLRKTR